MEKMNIWAGLKFIRIAEGKFIFGSLGNNEYAWDDEKPQHSIDIPYEYWVGKYPISVSDFGEFTRATSYLTRAEMEGWCWVWNVDEMKWEKSEGANWKNPGIESSTESMEQHPVVQVCWYDARAYCDWLNQTHIQELPAGYHFRLPVETEWEKAARGTDGSEWPWGNEFDAGLCNSRESGRLSTIQVGAFSPRGDSVYGAADMSGNIWEWTLTLWGDDRDKPSFVYPYRRDDGRENQRAGEKFFRIIRGGSYKDDLKGVRSACRDIDPPHYSLSNLGFRVFAAPIVA